jgi:hypothetical protein
MSLISLVLVLLCGVLTVLAGLDVVRQRRAIEQLRGSVIRQRAYRAERERFRAVREQVVGTTDLTTGIVNLPTAVTRKGHETIAAIPFTVLENIPATAEASKVVRAIHDEIADAVYDAISGTTKSISDVIRRGLGGSPSAERTDAPSARPRLGPSPAAVPDAVDDAAAEGTPERPVDG